MISTTATGPVPRSLVNELPAYPGRRATGAATAALASNESHYDPLPTVPEVVHAVVAGQAILWVRTSDEFREAILDALDRQDILVRGDPGDGVRISLADAATNDRVIAALGDRHSFKAIR